MKVILAPDSFKGSLSAAEVCAAMERGIRSVQSEAEVVAVPLADGGEGTVEALVLATGGQTRHLSVCGPLGEPIGATYGLLGNSDIPTAVVETASAAGLPLVPEDQRNPLNTTTYGLGELILDALEQGARRVLIGLGGSATNDCGAGMAQSLGARFYNTSGREIEGYLTGRLIGAVDRIDCTELQKVVTDTEFIAACDVTNPLLGPSGATYTYGPQKGADAAGLEELEANMSRIIDRIEAATGRVVRQTPGAGAAGGLGAGVMAFLDAQLQSGVELIMRESRLEEKLADADLVLTGEGRIDATTLHGKTLSGVARLAQKHNIPVISLAGSVDPDLDLRQLQTIGIHAAFSICPGPIDLPAAMKQAPHLLQRTTAAITQLIKL